MLSLLVCPLWAGQALNIYTAKALVKSQSEAERNRAARETLGEVVVRVSGQASATANPEVQQALSSAQNFLYGFSYSASSEQIIEGDKSFPAMEVELNYSPEAIQQLLRQAQLPLWPVQRPKVLVWLIMDDAAGVHVDTDESRLQRLREAAAYRGLPLALPSVDAAMGVPADKLWRFSLNDIQGLSHSYRADAVLVGRYHPLALGGEIPPASYEIYSEPAIDTADYSAEVRNASSANQASSVSSDVEPAPIQGPWLVDWQLLRGDEHQSWSGQVDDIALEFAAQIDRMADIFAREYAVMPSDHGPQVVSLRIGGINDFAGFKRAQAYLSSLAMVKQMDVEKVDSTGLLVKLSIEGDIKLLVSTLALGKKLQPENAQLVLEILNRSSTTAVTEQQEVASNESALAAALDQEIASQHGMEPSLDTAEQQLQSADGTVNENVASGNESAPGSETNPLIYLWKP